MIMCCLSHPILHPARIILAVNLDGPFSYDDLQLDKVNALPVPVLRYTFLFLFTIHFRQRMPRRRMSLGS